MLKGFKREYWYIDYINNNPNQLVVVNYETANRVFISYKTIVAVYNPISQELWLDDNIDTYTMTTRKHLKKFISSYTDYDYDNDIKPKL